MTDTVTVYLVDDHAVVRTGLRALLESRDDIRVVGEAGTAESALPGIDRLHPRVVLMDLALGGGMDGVDATRAITTRHRATAVVVFSTYDSDADVVRSLDAGAVGYLLKDAAPAEIYRAVHAAARGESPLSAPVAARLVRSLRKPGTALTPREAELVSLLAEGLSNRELGRRLSISEATVKTHLAHVYAKFGVTSRGAAMAHAVRAGIVRDRATPAPDGG